jgi:hypothetical protein
MGSPFLCEANDFLIVAIDWNAKGFCMGGFSVGTGAMPWHSEHTVKTPYNVQAIFQPELIGPRLDKVHY